MQKKQQCTTHHPCFKSDSQLKKLFSTGHVYQTNSIFSGDKYKSKGLKKGLEMVCLPIMSWLTVNYLS